MKRENTCIMCGEKYMSDPDDIQRQPCPDCVEKNLAEVRLRESADDLLKALEEIVDQFPEKPRLPVSIAVVNIAKKAIAKATGKGESK